MVRSALRRTQVLEMGSDYVMKAETGRWVEMGKGDYGPMRAMMLGRLGFDGPKMEAMGNMGPFENFLLLVGKVRGDVGRVPGDERTASLRECWKTEGPIRR